MQAKIVESRGSERKGERKSGRKGEMRNETRNETRTGRTSRLNLKGMKMVLNRGAKFEPFKSVMASTLRGTPKDIDDKLDALLPELKQSNAKSECESLLSGRVTDVTAAAGLIARAFDVCFILGIKTDIVCAGDESKTRFCFVVDASNRLAPAELQPIVKQTEVLPKEDDISIKRVETCETFVPPRRQPQGRSETFTPARNSRVVEQSNQPERNARHKGASPACFEFLKASFPEFEESATLYSFLENKGIKGALAMFYIDLLRKVQSESLDVIGDMMERQLCVLKEEGEKSRKYINARNATDEVFDIVEELKVVYEKLQTDKERSNMRDDELIGRRIRRMKEKESGKRRSGERIPVFVHKSPVTSDDEHDSSEQAGLDV